MTIHFGDTTARHRPFIDRQQRVRNIYGLDFLDPRLLMADVQTLLLEERQARR